jgi:hypothetical protein
MITENRKIDISYILRPAIRHQSFLLSHGDLLLSMALLDKTCSSFIIGSFFLLYMLLFILSSLACLPFFLDNY